MRQFITLVLNNLIKEAFGIYSVNMRSEGNPVSWVNNIRVYVIFVICVTLEMPEQVCVCVWVCGSAWADLDWAFTESRNKVWVSISSLFFSALV